MPNWTHNTFRVEAPAKRIKELKKKFKSKDNVFDFNTIIPMPDDSDTFYANGGLGEAERKKFGENNWYDWSARNWGTKWNSVRAEISDETETSIEYSFDTAWDAPRGISKALCENNTLEGCTDVNWSCSHEFEEDMEQLIWTEKKGLNNG